MSRISEPTSHPLSPEQVRDIDLRHIWHPYSSLTHPIPAYQVVSAEGVRLRLADGHELIDGMSSWWSVIHGYNHPAINAAVETQLRAMSHVMFGGIVHEPAAKLAQTLSTITPDGLDKVFFSDSGSVAVEVAIKMALQYWQSQGLPKKSRLLALKGGYHGDTFAAMSVCDPVTGMHHLFSEAMRQQLFAERPGCRFNEPCGSADIADIERLIETHREELAAVILEPVVQGAGGMYFYSPDYLRQVRQLCDRHDVLLIADEIATGFGRTGKLFACDWANISPDILCVGKALTGGYMTLAATLCTERVATGICNGEAGVFMHGPTFMANPLACAAANASLELLLSGDWASNILRIQRRLSTGLAGAKDSPYVKEVRVLGAIGVIEMKEPVNLAKIQKVFVDRGVWIRPFGTRVYTMPPYVISDEDLDTLCRIMCEVVSADPYLQES
ncbi:MAG: adenosylmethionine--8-amino-7-oxononanoate transaminase [bacterium]